MFLIDVSPSMGATRSVELPPTPSGEERTKKMTNLEWALQFVKLKIQEMVHHSRNLIFHPHRLIIIQIFNGRKTDQCGVILFGSEGSQSPLSRAAGFLTTGIP
jgi:ATP-dependent DNA helicase 2 subunit 2